MTTVSANLLHKALNENLYTCVISIEVKTLSFTTRARQELQRHQQVKEGFSVRYQHADLEWTVAENGDHDLHERC